MEWAPRLTPSALVVHCEGERWESVLVESQNLRGPLTFQRPGPTVKVSPIEHGVYNIEVTYRNIYAVWAAYFHADAGVRRRVDVYVSHVPGGDKVRFRCVITNRPTALFSSTETVFNGEVSASKTSREHPLILSWI